MKSALYRAGLWWNQVIWRHACLVLPACKPGKRCRRGERTCLTTAAYDAANAASCAASGASGSMHHHLARRRRQLGASRILG